MKKLLCLLVSLALMAPAFVFAESAEKAETDRIAELEARVARLEEMLEALTKGDALADQEEAEPAEPAAEPEASVLSAGDSFEVLDDVKLTVSDFEFSNYFTYYSRQNNSYSDFFGFSPFFGGSSYGQRTIRSGNDNIYLCLKIRAENNSAEDITVGDLMNALADCGGDPVEPEQSFLYYSGNYGGYIAGETTLQLGPRSSVDGLLIFIMPADARSETAPLNVNFKAKDGAAYRYALRAGESGLLLDQFGESQSF